ncbi:MAG: methyltransferase regulatory domain-containing protein [Planctomycetia bacterium]|nr:methyltransferase regulatory domain-containing protein [Planctomycetia bacterium]
MSQSATHLAGQPAGNSYDDVPYPSNPIDKSHPDRLHCIAAIFGMRPAPVDRCRVLEIGCAGGGNLLPMAEALPDSQFVGIDLSSRQIEQAKTTARTLDLSNVELQEMNILDVDERLGKFDYVICHGVFSWVRRQLQDKLFSICAENLRPQGVAMISYNTYPGWRMRGIVRDMMSYHAQQFSDLKQRIEQAKAMLSFIVEAASKDEPYGQFLRSEAKMLEGKPDGYLFHEHLEETNEPLYFHDFVSRAAQFRVQYLADTSISSMLTKHLPPEVRGTLKILGTDQIKTEQYLDFLRNRMFRHTLLCHADVTLNRKLTIQPVLDLFVASNLAPQDKDLDLRSVGPAVFKNAGGMVTSHEPLGKAAFWHLHRIWPRAERFPELVKEAQRLARSGEPDPEQTATDTDQLAAAMLDCFLGEHLELHSLPSPFVSEISERPVASRSARLQAAQSPIVTNRRHELVALDDVNRQLVRYLDGTHGRGDLVSHLTRLARDGQVRVEINNRPVADGEKLREALANTVDVCLPRLAQCALLVN